jgi:hypothetical protein
MMKPGGELLIETAIWRVTRTNSGFLLPSVIAVGHMIASEGSASLDPMVSSKMPHLAVHRSRCDEGLQLPAESVLAVFARECRSRSRGYFKIW